MAKMTLEIDLYGFDDDCKVCQSNKQRLTAEAIQLIVGNPKDNIAYSQVGYPIWSHIAVDPDAHGHPDPGWSVYTNDMTISRVEVRRLGLVLPDGHNAYLVGGSRHGDTLFMPWLRDVIEFPVPYNWPAWTIDQDDPSPRVSVVYERYIKTEWVNDAGATVYTHEEAKLPT